MQNIQTGFERRKESTRDAIRQAALDLFNERGIKKVSLAEIAAKAGVSPVSIYNHFSSKDGLVRDILKRLMDETLGRVSAILEGEGSFIDKMQGCTTTKTSILHEVSPELIQAMCATDPELRAHLDSVTRQTQSMFMKLLAEGRTEGYINPDLSNETIILYIEMFKSFVMERYPSVADPQGNLKLGKELSSLFFYGLLGREGPDIPLVGAEKETA